MASRNHTVRGSTVASGGDVPAARFTPGPWSVGHPGHGVRVESERDHGVANDGWIIADLLGPDAPANARLIAAAPDLYEALRRAAELLDIMSRATGSEEVARAAQDCRAALSKVEA